MGVRNDGVEVILPISGLNRVCRGRACRWGIPLGSTDVSVSGSAEGGRGDWKFSQRRIPDILVKIQVHSTYDSQNVLIISLTSTASNRSSPQTEWILSKGSYGAHNRQCKIEFELVDNNRHMLRFEYKGSVPLVHLEILMPPLSFISVISYLSSLHISS